LVKHLLVADLTKRFGNMKNGIADIKNHRFFSGYDWVRLLQKTLRMNYIPNIKSPNDVSNFSSYPDSATLSPPVKRSDDPFIDW